MRWSRFLMMLVLLGCGSAVTADQVTYSQYPLSNAVQLELDQTDYIYGDTAVVLIKCVVDSVAVLAPMCDLSIEGRRAKKWFPVFVPDCTRVRVRPTRLASGMSASRELLLSSWPPEATPQYDAFRIRVRFQLEGSSGGYAQSYSREFQVLTP